MILRTPTSLLTLILVVGALSAICATAGASAGDQPAAARPRIPYHQASIRVVENRSNLNLRLEVSTTESLGEPDAYLICKLTSTSDAFAFIVVASRDYRDMRSFPNGSTDAPIRLEANRAYTVIVEPRYWSPGDHLHAIAAKTSFSVAAATQALRHTNPPDDPESPEILRNLSSALDANPPGQWEHRGITLDIEGGLQRRFIVGYLPYALIGTGVLLSAVGILLLIRSFRP